MATFVDFEYYEDTYLGTTIPSETIFDAWALRASATIDRFTFNRADAIITANEKESDVTGIKMATCAVADELYNQSLEDSDKAIKSESVGGHSVSYLENTDLKRTQLEKQREAARLWLESTYLMTGAFYSGEEGSSVDDLDD